MRPYTAGAGVAAAALKRLPAAVQQRRLLLLPRSSNSSSSSSSTGCCSRGYSLLAASRSCCESFALQWPPKSCRVFSAAGSVSFSSSSSNGNSSSCCYCVGRLYGNERFFSSHRRSKKQQQQKQDPAAASKVKDAAAAEPAPASEEAVTAAAAAAGAADVPSPRFGRQQRRRRQQQEQHGVQQQEAAATAAEGSSPPDEEASAAAAAGTTAWGPAAVEGPPFAIVSAVAPPSLPSLPAIGLLRRPAFPGFYQLLQIPDQELFDALVRLKSGGGWRDFVGGFLVKKEPANEEDVEPGARLREDAGIVSSIDEIHPVGCLLHVLTLAPHANHRGGQAIVMPYRRIKLLGPSQHQPSGAAAEEAELAEEPAAAAGAAAAAAPAAAGADGAADAAAGNEEAAAAGPTVEAAAKPERAVDTETEQQQQQQQQHGIANVSQEQQRERGKGLQQGDSAGHQGEKQQQEEQQQEQKQRQEQKQQQEQQPEDGKQPAGPQPTSLLPVSWSGSSSGSSSSRSRPLLYVAVSFPRDNFNTRSSSSSSSSSSNAGPVASDVTKMLHFEILATMKELLKTSYFYKENFEQVIRFYNLEQPQKLADLVAGMSFARRDELQAVLAEDDLEKRLMLVLQIAKKDLEFAKLQVHVKAQVEDKMTRVQRKFLLQEQLKFIKKELGFNKDDKESIIDQFRELFAKKERMMSEEAQKAVTTELSKLSSLDQASSEFHVSRTYLENILSVPWGDFSSDCTDIEEAARVLDADHFGLKDVKRRILEFIAVTILKKNAQGKILCFVGPPGVGKTSVGESIARALHRKYYRISLGGLFDVAELRGHRRTYVGSLPGKIIQAMKLTKTMNPLILLDEIDKLGRDFRGDPSSALLEILDPSQNVSFRDHYLDVPVDLTKVLFVCTANTQDNIPGPLLDRMEIIRIAGYILEEKIAIAMQYLIPKTAEATGLGGDKVTINPEALTVIARDYAREAGVRSLSKCIDKLFRRAALSIVKKETDTVNVTKENLTTFVDQPPWTSTRLFEETQPGVVMGLAWTAMGGAVIFVEAVGRLQGFEPFTDKSSKAPSDGGSGTLKVTGQLGGVMSESCQIAMTFARSFLAACDPSNHYLEKAHIHLHVPEGATPKDGPSAGITLATALLSLALNKNPKPDLAMTGELTLTGKVLKVGGIKEKVIAAKREELKTLVFPKGNQRDFEELPGNIKEGLEIHFVETYQQVFDIVFRSADQEKEGAKEAEPAGVLEASAEASSPGRVAPACTAPLLFSI